MEKNGWRRNNHPINYSFFNGRCAANFRRLQEIGQRQCIRATIPSKPQRYPTSPSEREG